MSDATSSGSLKLTCRAESCELIAQVQRRACLWDRECRGYRSRADKAAAWRDVCAALEPGFSALPPRDQQDLVLAVVRRWYNIRDAYKKTRDRTGSARQYCYADQLGFLDAALGAPGGGGGGGGGGRRRTAAAPKYVAVDDNEQEKDGEDGEDGEEWLNEYVDFEQTEPSPAKRPRMEALARTSGEKASDALAVLASLIEREGDDDRAFFTSVMPAVKALPDDAKFVFRIQVMKLLSSLRKRSDAALSDSD